MAKLQCFNKRNEAYFQKHKHSFVGFFTAGYPDKEQFFDIYEGCRKLWNGYL